jgi:threonine aldolase
MVHTVSNRPDGVMNLAEIQSAIRPDDVHHPVSRLIVLENTQNRCGGAVLPADYIKELGEFAINRNLSLHIDGARIFNAAAALGVSAREIVEPADTVTFCLSKGLCAPVGSVLCGTGEFIHKARRLRKALGGGMRQAGILAAAGIYALENMVDRLKEDHQRARTLADGLAKIPGLSLKDAVPPSNMIFVTLADDVQASGTQVVEKLKENNIKVGLVGTRQIRMVLHYWVNDGDVEHTVKSFKKAF